MLQNILMIATGVLAGAIAALQFIAPRTATTVDDSVLAKLESLESMLLGLTQAAPAPVSPSAPAPATPAPAPAKPAQ